MDHRGRRAQGEVIDFIEQKLGWDVVAARVDEDERIRDEATYLEMEIVAEIDLDDDASDWRFDPDVTEVSDGGD